jgi:spore coat polysaccharide biosynthesis predicted glycosyltransferase SpsG
MASRTGGTVSSVAVSRATLQAVAEAAHSTPGAHLTVKVHPGDSTTVPQEVMSSYPEFDLVRSGNSQDVIMDSDLVIVVSSTTGYEACLADRPLIVLDLTGMQDHLGRIEYEKYGAAIVLTHAEDLALAIQRLLTDETLQSDLAGGRRKLIDDMLNGGSGNAAELAAGLIKCCLEDAQ